jgi:serine/threonine protein kinase
MEKADNSLQNYIRILKNRQTHIEPEYLKSVFWQVSMAVKDLQNLGLCHGDIKPGNILIFRNGDVKLCDLGSIRPLGTKNTCRSAICAEPEWFKTRITTKKSDVYSIGICLLYSCMLLDYGYHTQEEVQEAISKIVTDDPECRYALDILMTEKCPEISEVVAHFTGPWSQ